MLPLLPLPCCCLLKLPAPLAQFPDLLSLSQPSPGLLPLPSLNPWPVTHGHFYQDPELSYPPQLKPSPETVNRSPFLASAYFLIPPPGLLSMTAS